MQSPRKVRSSEERRKWSKMAESDENSIDSENDNEDLYKGYEHDYDRIERLFKDLDRNRDGKIDADELAAGLKRLRVRHSKGQLKVGFLKCLIIYLSPILKMLGCSGLFRSNSNMFRNFFKPLIQQ